MVEISEHGNILNKPDSLARIAVKVMAYGILNAVGDAWKLVFDVIHSFFAELHEKAAIRSYHCGGPANGGEKTDFSEHVSLLKLID